MLFAKNLFKHHLKQEKKSQKLLSTDRHYFSFKYQNGLNPKMSSTDYTVLFKRISKENVDNRHEYW